MCVTGAALPNRAQTAPQTLTQRPHFHLQMPWLTFVAEGLVGLIRSPQELNQGAVPHSSRSP